MRISLLEHREKFYEILKDTLNNYVKEKGVKSDQIFFVVNKYLNFIATPNLGAKSFKILVNEYSNSKVKWKKTIQFCYVRLAVQKWIRVFFSHRIIKLPDYFSNYLILGGNHRIRFFSESIEGSLVVLKSNERSQYILNDIFLRKTYDLSFAPKILDKGRIWFIEECFEGIPINRINNKNIKIKYLDIIVSLHNSQLVNKSKEILSLEKYKELVNSDINKIKFNNNFNKELYKSIFDVISLLFKYSKEKLVQISWTHGDFQEANILIKNELFKVIDWESSDKRFYLYDYFTLFGKTRTNISIIDSINLFKNKISVNANYIYFLLIEEIRFSVNEESSLNFFSSGEKTKKLCNDILNYINE